MLVRQEASDLEIVLEEQPLGQGGEAIIYGLKDLPGLVAKLYRKPTAEHAGKIAAMIAAPPDDPMAKAGHASIAWPIERLFAGENRKQFAGYLMPRIDKARLIYEYYNPRSRQQFCPMFHYGYLVRTARNLAASVRALHECGYVIGDVNESNVLVTSQALVSLVDTDSFQVPSSRGIFRCRVGKPEYTPPELQGARFTDVDRTAEHDAFGLAVLIFQLLMQGAHPFTGVYTGTGEASSIPRRIVSGSWPYVLGKVVPVKPSPHAPAWEVLPPTVQTLMRECFQDGHDDPTERPTALDWQRALDDAEKVLIPCGVNPQHLYHDGLDSCPWCDGARQHGRDPFPTAPNGKTTQRPAAVSRTSEPAGEPAAGRQARGPASEAAAGRQTRRASSTKAVPAVTPAPAVSQPSFSLSQVGPALYRRYRNNVSRAVRDSVLLIGCSGVLSAVVLFSLTRGRTVPPIPAPPPPTEVVELPPPPKAPPEAPFRIAVAPEPVAITAGARKTVVVKVERGPGFQGPIRLEITNLPAGVTVEPVTLMDDRPCELVLVAAEGFESRAVEATIRAFDVTSSNLNRSAPVMVAVVGRAPPPMKTEPAVRLPERKPVVLSPDEFQVDYVRGAVQSYVWSRAGKDLRILYVTDPAPGQVPVNPLVPGLPPAKVPPPRVPFPPITIIGPLRVFGPFPFPGMVPALPPAAAKAEPNTHWVPIEAVGKADAKDGKPVTAHVPVRMAVVQAAFPFRNQLKEFATVLGHDTLATVKRESVFEFLGVNVQRRTVARGVPSDWRDLNWQEPLRPYWVFGVEPEEAGLVGTGIVWEKDALAPPRPLLARDQRYPVALMPGIGKARAGVEKARGGAPAKEPMPARPQPAPPTPELGADAADAIYPDKCLLRFLDSTVEPGKVYEYRVQVRMVNPIHHLKTPGIPEALREEEIAGAWVPIPKRLTVPGDGEVYAADYDSARSAGVHADHVWVQVHRWIDWTLLNPGQPKESAMAIADWVVADQVQAFRGNYLGNWLTLEVPVWSLTRGQYVHAESLEPVKKGVRRPRGVPVDLNTGSVLVDFRGGWKETIAHRDDKDVKVHDQSEVVLLVLTPDGKLQVSRPGQAAREAQRRERRDDWVARTKAVTEKMDKGDVVPGEKK